MTDESIITNYMNNITLLPHTVLACWQVLVKLNQKAKHILSDMRLMKIYAADALICLEARD